MCKSGSVVLVNFPFSDLQSAKVRPALVLTVRGEDIIIIGIFSKVPEVARESWVKIDDSSEDFRLTGLKKTSVIKTERIATIHKSLVRRENGTLSPALFKKVKQTAIRTLELL